MEHAFLALPAVGLFAIAIAIEACLVIFHRREVYGGKEALCTLGVAALGRGLHFFTAFVTLKAVQLTYGARLMTLTVDSPGEWIALFFAVDFSYYWFHRLSHVCRWFWASHLVHHSPNVLRLSAAYRLGGTAGITGGFLVVLPLVLLGVEPKSVAMMFGLNLLYQFWLHTELVGKLGPLEWILNTPSQHRVHHASNPGYLDKNFGGVFCIFDRIFGTYRREEEKCVYGLVHPLKSNNPLIVTFWGWIELFKLWRAAGSWSERWLLTFSPPRDPAPRKLSVSAGAPFRTHRPESVPDRTYS